MYDIIKSEVMVFINIYNEKRRGHLRNNVFSLSDMEDTVNYEGLFPKKYSIYYRFEGKEGGKPEYLGRGYGLICVPTLETVFKFYDNLKIFHPGFIEFKDKVAEDLRKLLNEKYMIYRNKGMKRKVISLLNDTSLCECNYKIMRLRFYDGFKKYLIKYLKDTTRIDFMCDSESFCFIFGLLNKKFMKAILEFFRSPVVERCLFMGDFNKNDLMYENCKMNIRLRSTDEETEILKRSLIAKSLVKDDLLLKKNRYIEPIIAFLTFKECERILKKEMRRFERMEKDENLESLKEEMGKIKMVFIRAFNIEVILDVFYYFNVFYREGNHLIVRNGFVNKIIGVIKEISRSKHVLGGELCKGEKAHHVPKKQDNILSLRGCLIV
jgi:hypothetical protein